MTAQDILDVIGEEMVRLRKEKRLAVAIALGTFAVEATDAELLRFREIILAGGEQPRQPPAPLDI